MNILKYVFGFFILLTVTFAASDNYERYIVSEKSAIVYSDSLYEQGMFKESLEFNALALDKFPQSEKLLLNQAATLFDVRKIEEAQILFKKILSINRRNSIAQEYLVKINEQENLLLNPYLQQVKIFIKDKGFDFALIFFGFLYGALLSKAIYTCDSKDAKYLLNKIKFYTNAATMKKSFSKYAFFVLVNIFNRASNCILTSILMIASWSFGLALLIIFFEIIFFEKYISSIRNSEMLTTHILIVFLISILIVFIKIILQSIINNFIKTTEYGSLHAKLELISLIQRTIDNKDYSTLLRDVERIEEIIGIKVFLKEFEDLWIDESSKKIFEDISKLKKNISKMGTSNLNKG